MFRFVSVMILLAASACPPAHAEVTLCTEIVSLPTTISTQGVYCLKHDLVTGISSGTAITVAANNVTIDCNDWKIGGLAAGVATNAIGIGATDRVNITVRHCGVRGFYAGINFNGTSSGGHLIEDNRVDLNTYRGLYVWGDNLVVRRNRVLQTGGRPNVAAGSAVFLYGSGLAEDNVISGNTPTGGASGDGDAIGLNLGSGPFLIDRNLVSGLVPAGTGIARGIWGDLYPGSYRNNMVISNSAVAGTGIDGSTPSTPGASACSGNTVHGFNIGTNSCTDAGGNVIN